MMEEAFWFCRKEFTDRFDVNGECKPTERHPFDLACKDAGLEHRLIKPRHPQTNGMIERFNGRVNEVITHTRFLPSKELRATLYRYVRLYNHQIPQKALGHVTPVKALKNWSLGHRTCRCRSKFCEIGGWRSPLRHPPDRKASEADFPAMAK